MSKILRRPMFRGGGKVSSYGNGITTGLANGGMPAKRGLVNGPGGYAGVVPSWAQNADNRGYTLGSELYNKNVKPVTELETFLNSFKGGNYAGRNISDLLIQQEVGSDGDTANLSLEETDIDSRTNLQKAIDEDYKSEQGIRDQILEQGPLEIKDSPIITPPPDYEEPTTLSARDMVAQNKALFADLLGSKEARGKDISDMLLGFAGAEGNTLGEKFKDFTRIEAKRPGKVEKINEAAAALAINDYVAGKRSKEQGDAIRGKIDYEYGKKLSNAIPDVEDSYEVVSAKLNAMDAKPGSDKAIRAIVNMKDKTANVVVKSDIKLSELVDKPEKVLKKLDEGYNIVSDGRGNKRVIKYDGSGGIKGIEILTIQALWEG